MAKKSGKKKIFVLDTSVILFAHDSIMNFKSNDVGIPITVLEELDNFKKGNDTINFEAREFARLLDNLAEDHMLQDWIPLEGKGRGKLKVLMYSDIKTDLDAAKIFGDRKNDHKIINSALKLQKEEPNKQVILVSKDINLRLKAKSLDLHAEDYETGKIKDVDSMSTLGKNEVDKVSVAAIDQLYKSGEVSAKRALGDLAPINNNYYILKSSKNSALTYFNPQSQKIAHVEKKSVYGIKPKNAEQAFAIHAMTNPSVKLVAITGIAGTGKTLMALASALHQRRDFKQIYIARPIVPLSNKDIGYLPGDIKSKLNPYMEPLWDNLKFIQNQWKETEKDHQILTEMVNQEKVLITPLAYIRGRSLSNIYFIVDEAQNLTPHEVKTIITRAGENCKIVFTGDVNQIDTPYLDSQSNGLTYLVDRLQGQEIFAHITLEKGERSELANIANELL